MSQSSCLYLDGMLVCSNHFALHKWNFHLESPALNIRWVLIQSRPHHPGPSSPVIKFFGSLGDLIVGTCCASPQTLWTIFTHCGSAMTFDLFPWLALTFFIFPRNRTSHTTKFKSDVSPKRPIPEQTSAPSCGDVQSESGVSHKETSDSDLESD